MSLSQTCKLFLCAPVVLLIAALPCALAQQNDFELPELYPGAWFRLSLDTDGSYITGDGHGYNGGTWYHYPQTGWYRQWYYNQPYTTDREGYLKYEVYIKAVDPDKLTYAEVNFNWTTPEWSQLGLNRPPLPGDVATPDKEARYMASRRLYLVDGWYIGTVEPILSHIIEEYNPEWVSIDVRGQNAYLFRGAMHECRPKQGACCNRATGECTMTYEDECPADLEWLGPGTSCDDCTRGSVGKDFGDAPAVYQTLSTSNGPRHTKVAGVFLGNALDVEPEAKPDVSALGDDLHGSDDEDGIVFTSAMLPGESATLDATASTAGYINAWMDFNRDGDFADAGEQIFSDELLAPGVNRLSFRIPATAVMGTTFARFRFNTRGLLSWQGPATDGEVEDYKISMAEQFQPEANSGRGGLKWSQTPQRFDPTTPFIFDGWNERSDLSLHRILADDWRQEDERPVTGFQWWGSFEGWTQPMLPAELPLAFQITIWTNAGAAGSGRPDTLVWEKFCTNWTWSLAGYHSDPRGLGDDTCFQFTCPLSQDQWFRPTLVKDKNNASIPAVYWLSIAVIYNTTVSPPAYPWGWTTRPQFFGAGAEQISAVAAGNAATATWPPTVGSRRLSGSSIENPQGTAWDLAFELLTNQGSSANDPDLAPVYRFWCGKLSTHFYTISEAEKDALLGDPSQTWAFEGIVFYAYPPERAPLASKPVYRFWSDNLSRHFYTISETERQTLVNEQSRVWTQEGVAWHAFE